MKVLFSQKKYEKTIYVLRRHWNVFIEIILFYCVLGLIPPILYWFFLYNFPDILINVLVSQIILPIIILGVSIYYLSIWLFFFTSFVDYYLDTWTVTNDRIISIDQQGLFARTVSELDLYKIQDVTSETKGFFPTIFSYGNVYIQTAAEKERFIFEQVPNPNEIRQEIIKLMEEDRKYHLSQTTLLEKTNE